MSSRPIDPQAIQNLQKKFPKLEIWTDPEKTLPYQKDESMSGGVPMAVVFPRSADEVAAILKEANSSEISIIPRGAGSGLSGASVPIDRALVLSLEKMQRVLEIDKDALTVTVEPGVITGTIRDCVQKEGLFYPPIPASVDFCTIGGNVATNAGGLCAVKYGVTREYVTALEAVLPTGEIIHTGGSFIKNTTGYNLTQLLIGSEGTLAVITKITLKLLPLPKHRHTLLCAFDSLESVSQTVIRILSEQIRPPTMELLPNAAVKCVLDRHPDLSFPFKDSRASLLIELDAPDEADLDAQLERLTKVLRPSLQREPILAATESQRTELWNVRKLVRESISRSGEYVEADSVVPRNRLPELLMASEEVSQKHQVDVISYGHAGDGNLHTYFLRKEIPLEKWESVSEKALNDFFDRTIELGGTISGEHGIGYLKKEYLPKAIDWNEIRLMKRIKEAFDPNGILNPGKVFPDGDGR